MATLSTTEQIQMLEARLRTEQAVHDKQSFLIKNLQEENESLKRENERHNSAIVRLFGALVDIRKLAGAELDAISRESGDTEGGPR